jgi:APA family basic amino acid/polyamine antiporter
MYLEVCLRHTLICRIETGDRPVWSYGARYRSIIGSGIFVVTGIVAGIAGPAMIISVLIAGIIALFSAMSVAELIVYLPEEGGTCAYAQKLISPFAGFIAGWIWIFSNIFVGTAVSLGFAHYFVTRFPVIPVKVYHGNNLPDIYHH